jgi:Skp family chaperone for outer membrane proteins
VTSDPILSAVQDVAQDVRDLRVEITGRMDQMVTRREHEAEVRRLDSAHASLQDAHDDLRRAAEIEHESLRTALAADQAERKAERSRVEDARRADRRTFIQVTVAAVLGAVTVAVAIVSLILTI